MGHVSHIGKKKYIQNFSHRISRKENLDTPAQRKEDNIKDTEGKQVVRMWNRYS